MITVGLDAKIVVILRRPHLSSPFILSPIIFHFGPAPVSRLPYAVIVYLFP
jgi:hypothetical protein